MFKAFNFETGYSTKHSEEVEQFVPPQKSIHEEQPTQQELLDRQEHDAQAHRAALAGGIGHTAYEGLAEDV